jgi:hypothetical protein
MRALDRRGGPLSTTTTKSKLGPFGGFGVWERPGEQSGCGLPKCDKRLISPTDLYCHSHDRFLLFMELTSGERGFIIALLSVLIYGSVELTAQLNSVIPVDLSYTLIGLCVISLPLRKFAGTCWMAAVLWLLTSAFSLAFQFTGDHFRVVISTAFLLILVSLSAVWAVSDADEASIAIHKRIPGPFPAGAASLIACGLIGAVASLVVGLAAIGNARVWHGDESSITQGSFVAAACFMAASILVAIVIGFIFGTGRIRRDVPEIKQPRRPRLKDWSVHLSPPTRRPVYNVVDRISEAAILAIFRTSEIVLKASVSLARLTVNFLLIAMYILVRLLVAVANKIIRMVVLAFRTIVAAVAAAGRVFYRSCVSACEGIARVTVNLDLPVMTLAVASLLTAGAAEESRRYIVESSPRILLIVLVRVVIALLLATITWIALASQEWARSRRSAEHSAGRAAPYVLLFVAIGGWLLGLPGTLFGYGRIHVGWLTLTSTGLIVLAIILRPVLNRISSRP